MKKSFLMLSLLLFTSIINCHFLQDEDRSIHVRNKDKENIDIYNADYSVSLLEKTIILRKNTTFYIEFIEEDVNENIFISIRQQYGDEYISFDKENPEVEKIPNTNKRRILLKGYVKDFKGEIETKEKITLFPSNALRTINFRVMEKNNLRKKEYIGFHIKDINDPILPILFVNCKRNYLNRLTNI